MSSTPLRRISAEDLFKFRLINDCRISPCGSLVVYSLQRNDRKTLKRYSNLWVVETTGGAPRDFTNGDQSDTNPRWSPSGDGIAFLSNRKPDTDGSQVYVIRSDGGEARCLTNMEGEFGSLQWTPDGKRIVCTFRKAGSTENTRENDGKSNESGPVFRHYNRVFFKSDGTGYLTAECWQLWSIDAQTGKGVQLTTGPYDVSGFDVSPDGRWIALVSNRSGIDPGLQFDNIALYVLSIEGGELRKIETPYGEKACPSISPDGTHIAYVGKEGPGGWGRSERLYVVPVYGTSKALDLTGPYDITVTSATINDLAVAEFVRPAWSPDGDRIYTQVSHRGSTELRSVRTDGSDLRLEIGGPGVVGAFSFDNSFNQIAYFYGDMSNPGHVFVRGVKNGRVAKKARKLTRNNDSLLRRIDLGTMEEIWFDAADGSMKLHGWVLHPPEFDPSQTYPSILDIHGGPHLQYGHYFMHEFYYLAAQGYVVYFANPRGGQGYGETHARAIENAWGTVDYEDIMKWVDVVSQRRYIDSQRCGVTGGSYGGYLTNWIIGHTDRFSAAVTQRSVSNLISQYGSSDNNWTIQRELGDELPWADVENYWKQSPIAHIENAKTPTLVIHSERDFRCTIEQGEQLYVALKKLGIDTELVVFPDESHGLSRSGRTDRRIARLKQICGWFDRYLKQTW